MRATLAGSSFMDSMPLPPPPEVKRRSFWNKLFGSPSTPLQEPTETQIAATLRTWRASHQPACLRLERTLAQARKALAKTRAQVADLADSPAMSLHTTIPGGGGGFSENERPLPSAMTESPIMLLRRRERGLMILCEQLQGRLAVAQAQAEALSDKRARMHLLVEALGRCRCVYEDAQIVIHAPQPALQESFEAAVCARRAREGRLLHQWVDLFEKQLRKGADAAGEMYTPPPQVVLDFVVYLSRLVVAQHGLSGLLPQSARAGFSSSLSMRTDKQALGALGSAPTAKLTPSKVLAKEVAEREALVDFLQQERAVDELVEALVL
eukprot:jgi/Chrpa1/23357/Chrysochromulina_OHIO_Genome00009010-RA